MLLPIGQSRAPAGSLSSIRSPAVWADGSTDPQLLLEHTLSRCDTLDAYQIDFRVRERLGLPRRLEDWKHITVDYRKDPKTIRMAWRNPDSEYVQATYIEGRNQDKIWVIPRRGLFGLTPRPFSVEVAAPVSYGKTLRPITDMGLAELIRVTLKEMQRARGMGHVRIAYAGRSRPLDVNELADHVVIYYPHGYADATRQDIYISTQTGYPIAAYFWQPDGDLLAAYLYGRPNSSSLAMEH